MKLGVKIQEQGADVEIILSGVLDERCELPELKAPVKGHLMINLEQLFMINSLGCRKWVIWIKTLKAGKGISLVKCSPPAVNQMNILAGFIPENVKVDSVYVPYFCEACSKDHQLLFEPSSKDSAKQVAAWPEEITCESCKGTMELDVLKQRYFNFLSKKTA